MAQGRRASTRITSAVVVLAVHVFLMMAWWWGSRSVPRSEPVPQFVSLWPADQPPELRAPVPAPLRSTPPASRTAITLAPTSPRPDAAPDVAPTENDAPAEPFAPGVDWAREATLAARRQSEPEPPAATFSEPPPKPREPCRVKPWKWKPQEKRAGIAPLPYVVIGKRCIIGLGFFGCSLGEPAEVASDQLDDYKKGDGAGPSVPDPNVCD